MLSTNNQNKKPALGFILSLGVALLLGQHNPVNGATLDLAQTPLFLVQPVAPNILVMLDDSGSMDSEMLFPPYWAFCNYNGLAACTAAMENHGEFYSQADPGIRKLRLIFNNSDNVVGSGGNPGACVDSNWLKVIEACDSANTLFNKAPIVNDWRVLSADANLLYYNPRINYAPWPDDASLTNGSFTAARSNPKPGTMGYDTTPTRNFATTGMEYAMWIAAEDKGFTGVLPAGRLTYSNTANGRVDLWDPHYHIRVTGTTISIDKIVYAPDASSLNASSAAGFPQIVTTLPEAYCSPACGSSGRTLADEQTNIANWYQYARRRSFVANNALGTGLKNYPNFRYSLATINDHASAFKEFPDAAVSDFTAHNNTIRENLYSYNSLQSNNRGTPLRTALQDAGKYYNSAETYKTGEVEPITEACQQNFTLLTTDGYWNGSLVGINDVDLDGYSNSLADVAKKYYDTDLNTSLPNQVPVNSFDTQTQQHMVTFGVAFGVAGNLVDTDGDGWPNPVLAENDNWGDIFSSLCGSECAPRVDDLWHAAYNSRGAFISARTAQQLIDGLDSTLAAISGRITSSSSAALTSSIITTGTKVFQARMDTSNWGGQLLAFSVDSGGVISTIPAWDTAAPGSAFHAQSWSSRVILTYKPSTDTGIAFTWPANPASPGGSELDASQIDALRLIPAEPDAVTESRLQYLRGNPANEGPSVGQFRDRVNSAGVHNKLGDLSNSSPVYVGDTFLDGSAAGRAPMLYIGSNDGMLHGFDAETGAETIAYIPSMVFDKLSDLSDLGYSHSYLVDGSPTAADVGSQTILIGALGGGGQGMFALDVTDPSQFSESNAATLALWEFDDDPTPDAGGDVRGDADLGFTYGQATVGKINASTHAAFFGNGYNNTESDSNVGSGHAALYLVDAQTGVLMQKLDTATTGAVTVTAADPPNGLSTPEVIDGDHDGIADTAYAGDLYGNLWKFRRTGSGTTWEIAYNKPLFTAPAGQAITVRPKVNVHPNGGYMVNFGTGKYIETNDNSNINQPTQAFYGIWDKDEATLSATIASSDLLQQTIHEEHIVTGGSGSVTVRETSDNEPDWTHPTSPHFGWYMNLIVTGSSDNRGERVVTDPVRRNGRIVFTTLLPSTDRCDFGGSSWIMALDATTGKRTNISVFDINDDGYFSQDADMGGDLVTSNTETNALGDPIEVTVSGFQPTFGIIFGPRLIAVNPYANSGNYDEVIASSTSGELFSTFISSVAHVRGRKAWRQVLK